MAALLQACSAEMSMYGARCRTLMANGSIFCEEDHSNGSDMAPSPNTVLVKFTINPETTTRLVAAGVRQTEVISSSVRSAREAGHKTQARRMGVNPGVRPGRVDSGTAVFPKEDNSGGSAGAESITCEALIEELREKGFQIMDVHILPPKPNQRRNNPPSTLVLVFAKSDTESPYFLRSEAQEIIGELLSATWTAHIWANPAHDGNAVHTVNLIARSDQPAQHELLFVEGVWGIRFIAVAA